MPSTSHLGSLNLAKFPLLNLVLETIAGNHGDPAEGMIWYDSQAQAIKFHNGTAVQTLGVSGAGGDASTLEGNAGSFYLNRDNHEGTQLASTISNFAAAVAALSIDATTLGGQTAAQLTTAIEAAIIDSAPGTLDTLNELAAALNDDPNFATTITNAIALKVGQFHIDIPAGTSFELTHNLGTRDLTHEVYRTTTPWDTVGATFERTTLNAATLRFGEAVADGAYRVVVQGRA